MKIHGICLVKNEGDIMRYFLRQSAAWCDRIHVFDNGSTDATWTIAQELARTMPQIVPHRSDPRPFDDALRAEVFNQHRAEAAPGDWWCRLDADEIYIDDPRSFLAGVPRAHHVVWAIHLQFYLTHADRARFETESTAPEMTAENLPRHYRANASEPRFFRHRDGLSWPGGAWPRHIGLVHPRRIRLKHFQYRSPGQMQVRIATRREAQEKGWQHFSHTLRGDWESLLADAATLETDRGDGTYEIEERNLPRHLESPATRALKRLMHGFHLWP
jgi:hypothetical protein